MSLAGSDRQRRQGTWAMLLIHKMLLDAGLPSRLIGFMADSSEQATQADIDAYPRFMESVWEPERSAELRPFDLETPDICLPDLGPPKVLVEVVSIRTLDQGQYNTLPTPPKDIKQFLKVRNVPARYYEPGYLAYVVKD